MEKVPGTAAKSPDLFLIDFIAHPAIKNAHLQTILADRFPGLLPLPPTQKFQVRLEDGDLLVNEYIPGKENFVSLLCHGLSGDSQSNYIQRSAYHLSQLGHHVIMLNHRNCGSGFGLATKPYNSGSGKDIGMVVKEIRKKLPNHKVIVYGFSLSANALLNLISDETVEDLWPDYAFAANPPANLSRTSDMLSSGWNKVYEKNFIFALRDTIKKLKHPSLNKISRWMPIRAFDDVYTAPLSGYKDANDYYERCSTYKKFDRIHIPTLLITSDDDPFIDVRDFKNAQTSDAVKLKIIHGGGHLGYISKNKTPLGNYRWLDYAVLEFAKSYL